MQMNYRAAHVHQGARINDGKFDVEGQQHTNVYVPTHICEYNLSSGKVIVQTKMFL